MKDKNPNFESIRSKLLKLQVLAEKGYAGEAEAARLLLDKILKQHGVRLEDVLDQEKRNFFSLEIGKGKIWKDLFTQCYAKVTGKDTMQYYRQSVGKIYVKLSTYEFAEISNLFFWHKTNLKKDLEDSQNLVFEAYVQKHCIFSDRSNDPDDTEEIRKDKTIDFEHLQKVLFMMKTLNDNSFHKMIDCK